MRMNEWTHYQGLSDEDRRIKVEARITDTLAQYGGKRLVAGKVLNSLVQDLTSVIFTMKKDGLI